MYVLTGWHRPEDRVKAQGLYPARGHLSGHTPYGYGLKCCLIIHSELCFLYEKTNVKVVLMGLRPPGCFRHIMAVLSYGTPTPPVSDGSSRFLPSHNSSVSAIFLFTHLYHGLSSILNHRGQCQLHQSLHVFNVQPVGLIVIITVTGFSSRQEVTNEH